MGEEFPNSRERLFLPLQGEMPKAEGVKTKYHENSN